MNSNTSKKNLLIPAIVVSVVLLGSGMYVLGRSSVPALSPDSVHIPPEEAPQREEPNENGVISFSPKALKSAQIKVEPVVLKSQIAGLPFNGEIEASPDNVARVSSIVPGRITRLFVGIGQKVHWGQTLALVESRSVGEAQASYSQAVARLQNARSHFAVTQREARAGVFSRAPLETAWRAQIEAGAEVRAQETSVRQARVALDNVMRLSKAGSFARPSLDAAREQSAAAVEASKSAQAASDNADAAVQAAQSELARRRQIAQAGGYTSRPLEEARRVLTAAESARATAQSEVATTRANLSRAKSLAAEGLVSTRDLEAAQTAFDTATARQQSASADESAATWELARQEKLAASNVVGSAEVSEALARLAQAQADQKTRRAQVTRTGEARRLAKLALARENAVFGGNVANRREFSTARGNLANAQNALEKARQTFALNATAFRRESSIYRQNLNDISQIQSARATLISAQSDLSAARTTLSLLKSAPGGSAVVPLRAPLAGILQTRDVAQGEVVEADKNLMTIVNLETVHVDMFVPESDLVHVRVGAPVRVRVDALGGQSFTGRIELIHSELDPKTRTVEAHAEILNPGTLRPGMFARGTIGTGNSKLNIMVPADAVQDMNGGAVVFVAGKKTGQFGVRQVDAGATIGGQTLVKSGLNPGEKIVVQGAFLVKAQSMKAELGEED